MMLILLEKYDFNLFFEIDKLQLKELRFNNDYTTIFLVDKNKKIIQCRLRYLISNQTIISNLSPTMSFYVGFLFSFFTYDKEEIELSKFERPFLLLTDFIYVVYVIDYKNDTADKFYYQN